MINWYRYTRVWQQMPLSLLGKPQWYINLEYIKPNHVHYAKQNTLRTPSTVELEIRPVLLILRAYVRLFISKPITRDVSFCFLFWPLIKFAVAILTGMTGRSRARRASERIASLSRWKAWSVAFAASRATFLLSGPLIAGEINVDTELEDRIT